MEGIKVSLKHRSRNLWFLVVIAIGIMCFMPVTYSEDHDCTQPHEQCGHGDEDNDGSIDVNSNIIVSPETTSITNEAKRAPNNYLVMQNQVESCGRTFGLSGSNTSGGWALGIPIPRSWTPMCDLWRASEEAQQNGHIFTSYMFQCSIRAIRKVWGRDKCADFERRALIELGFEVDDSDATSLYNEEAQSYGVWLSNYNYDQLLLAQVQQEELDSAIEQAENRYSQQQSLNDELLKERDSDENEIKRLKKEINKQEERNNKESLRRAAAREALKKDDLIEEQD